MKVCPSCHRRIASNANPCPFCGRKFTSAIVWIVGIGVIVFVIWSLYIEARP